VKSIELLDQIVQVLKETEKKVEDLSSLSSKNKEKVLKMIREAAENFSALKEEVVIDNEKLASFFLKRATKLKNATNNKTVERLGEKEYVKDVRAILRYSKAAPYDFAGYMKYVNRAYKAYLWGLISFFIISGLFPLGFKFTSLLLLIPVLLSLLSLKKRGYTGLMLAFAVTPIPIITGAYAINYGIHAVGNPEEINAVAQAFGTSPGVAQVIIFLFLLLGLIDVVFLGYATYMFYKHRSAFL